MGNLSNPAKNTGMERRIRGGLTLAALCAAGMASAQLSGEINFSGISGHGPSHWLTQGHADRAQVVYESGPWRLVGSEFFYPFCDFNQLDETTLSHQAGPVRLRFGRFIPAVMQSSWYDQWDSGFVFIPDLERRFYFGRQTFWLTALGADAEYSNAGTTVTLGGVDESNPADQAAPKSLRRLNGRVQTLVKDVVVGAGFFIDPSQAKTGERIFDLDFRTGWSHFVFRGAAMVSMKEGDRFQGLFLDLSHRPQGQDWLTLVARYEVTNENSKAGMGPYGPLPAIHQELHAFTFGAKIMLPSEWFLTVNYRTGTQQPPMGYQNGWVFGLNRTFRF